MENLQIEVESIVKDLNHWTEVSRGSEWSSVPGSWCWGPHSGKLYSQDLGKLEGYPGQSHGFAAIHVWYDWKKRGEI